MSKTAMRAEIREFRVYEDASGICALVDVARAGLRATFAVSVAGDVEAPSCNLVGSGLSTRMTARAAEVARREVTLRALAETTPEWREAMRVMYSDDGA
jgi:hypothetical protein